jgi:hypothetical protein
MSKNKTTYFVLFILFIMNNLNGQSIQNFHLPKSGDQDFYSTNYKDVEKNVSKIHPLNFNAFDLKVVEVAGNNIPFAYNRGGKAIGYCGNVKGGIMNLLQRETGATPHIQFLNNPPNQRYVLFYGQGSYMSSAEVMDTSSKMECYGHQTFNVRDMVMTMMTDLFDFEIKQISDSLDVLKLKIIDYKKLQKYKKKLQECISGEYYFDENTKDYYIKCASMNLLTQGIERSLNIFTYDEANTGESDYFDIILPHKYLESSGKIDELNVYLETKYGLTLKKEKSLEKVYTIRFNNE